MTVEPMQIAGRAIGPDHPTYIIAEVSANHQQSIDKAKEIVREAAKAGADAVKLQTYTADTITLDSDKPWFRIGEGTLWEGRTLHALYEEAYTPWEWHKELKDLADGLGVHLFSSPFDPSAVDFLEGLDVPAYKIASFEIVDLPLIRYAAQTGKPLIISTGMARLPEIDAAVRTARAAGAGGVAVLRCNSSYPAPVEEMDLRTIQHMIEAWQVPVGLSDHTLGPAAAVTAVALGARLLEKHVTLSRGDEGPDSAFSTEPDELRELIQWVREAERAVGRVRYGPSEHEAPSLKFRRSLFVVKDMAEGETFSSENVRSIRPAEGLPPAELDRVLGRRARGPIERGTPLSWDLIA